MTTGETIQVTGECSKTAYPYGQAYETTLMVNVTGNAISEADEDKRQPLELCLLLDRSGSMASENKLNLCKKTVEMLVRELRADDYMSIVSYDSEVEVSLPWTSLSAKGKSKVDVALSKMNPGSCTNLSGALQAGMQLIKHETVSAKYGAAVPHKQSVISRSFSWLTKKKSDDESSPAETTEESRQSTAVKGRKPIMIVLTDGLANEGISEPRALANFVSKGLASVTETVQVFTYGYGSDHDAELLKTLSQATSAGGSYFFIENPDQISAAFADTIGGLMSTVGQNVRVTVAGVGGANIQGEPLTKFSYHINPNSVHVDLPDVYAEESRNFLVKFLLPALKSPVPGEEDAPVAKITYSYLNCLDGEEVTGEYIVGISRPEAMTSSEFEAADNVTVITQEMRHEVATSIEQARVAADEKRFDDGEKQLDLIQSKIDMFKERADGLHCDKEVQQLVNMQNDLVRSKQAYEDRATWHTKGKTTFTSLECEHHYQRPSANMSENACNYRTGAQKKMAKKMALF